MEEPVVRSSLQERVSELEEKINLKRAVINLAEQEIKLNTNRKNAVRRKSMNHAARKHYLNMYDVRIRQKNFERACAEDALSTYQTELKKLQAHLPKA